MRDVKWEAWLQMKAIFGASCWFLSLPFQILVMPLHWGVCAGKLVDTLRTIIPSLTEIASSQPHAAYSTFIHCLSNLQLFLCRTTPNIDHLLEPFGGDHLDQLHTNTYILDLLLQMTLSVSYLVYLQGSVAWKSYLPHFFQESMKLLNFRSLLSGPLFYPNQLNIPLKLGFIR